MGMVGRSRQDGGEEEEWERRGGEGKETPYVDSPSHLIHPGSQWFHHNAGLPEYRSHCCSGKQMGNGTQTGLSRASASGHTQEVEEGAGKRGGGGGGGVASS